MNLYVVLWPFVEVFLLATIYFFLRMISLKWLQIQTVFFFCHWGWGHHYFGRASRFRNSALKGKIIERKVFVIDRCANWYDVSPCVAESIWMKLGLGWVILRNFTGTYSIMLNSKMFTRFSFKKFTYLKQCIRNEERKS